MVETPQAVAAWTILSVWLGIQWIQGGWHKIADDFNASGFMQGAIAKAGGDHPAVQGWYAAFLENFALPNADLFSTLAASGLYKVKKQGYHKSLLLTLLH